jgi:hypothetical protein
MWQVHFFDLQKPTMDIVNISRQNNKTNCQQNVRECLSLEKKDAQWVSRWIAIPFFEI